MEENVKYTTKKHIEESNRWKMAIRAFIPPFDLVVNKYRELLSSINLDSAVESARTVDHGVELVNVLEAREGSKKLPILQSAAVELDDQELELSIKVFLISLETMQEYFNQIKITVVYLPSVVTVYKWKNKVKIVKYSKNRKEYTTTSENLKQSEKIRRKIEKACRERGIVFIDVTDALISQSKDLYLHGPKDWRHLNSIGNQIVAREIIKSIQ